MTLDAEGSMTATIEEAAKTLFTLEKLICVAEIVGLQDPAQRAALEALRGRRSALRRLIARRQKLKQQKIVCLAAWRDAPHLGSSAALAL
jgi:hypothetical protein